MCLFKESKLYIENAQKERNRAFFVCTLRMWVSIPDLDFLGAMSQLPHLYSTVCPPKLTWMGFSTMASSFLTPTSIGSSSSSLTGVAVGVGWCGSSGTEEVEAVPPHLPLYTSSQRPPTPARPSHGLWLLYELLQMTKVHVF